MYRQVGIIGAGRAAQAFALAIGSHSALPPLIWGRSPDRLRTAVERVGRAAIAARLDLLAGACDLVIIAVSDDAIASLVAEVAAVLPAGHAPFVFHLSGRTGAATLRPLEAKRALTAAIHPVMTFTGDPATEVQRMVGAYFAITSLGEDASIRARKVVELIGGVGVEIAEDRRLLYHAALCHAANHLVTLLSGSSHALRAAGVAQPGALMAPLVRAALENSLTHGFGALSGPLLRGDKETIAGHLDALEQHDPDLLTAYRAMALATLDELERSDASPPPPDLRNVLA